jgi:hypothetical protein
MTTSTRLVGSPYDSGLVNLAIIALKMRKVSERHTVDPIKYLAAAGLGNKLDM